MVDLTAQNMVATATRNRKEWGDELTRILTEGGARRGFEHGFSVGIARQQRSHVAKLSVKDGRHLGEASSGDGVDIVAYAPNLHHAYLPGAKSATMAVIGISSSGDATVLGTVTTAKGSHCVVTDERGNAYVCDPKNGQLLIFRDTLPNSH